MGSRLCESLSALNLLLPKCHRKYGRDPRHEGTVLPTACYKNIPENLPYSAVIEDQMLRNYLKINWPP